MFFFAFILVLLTSATFTNTTFSQVSPTPSSPSKPHLVKITSPAKGQQVPVGKDLIINGTSVSNKTADCKVSVKVNFINPYHDATPIGLGGNSDYSKWSFNLSPGYTTIKPGQNKITAKFACANNPTLTSHYSVNVTGVNNVANVYTGAGKNNIQQISSVATGLNSTTTAASSSNSTATNTTNSTRSPVSSNATFSASAGANSNNLRALSVSVHLGKSSLHPGDKQTITTYVADNGSANAIAGALVSESVTYGSYGQVKKFEGTTDVKGKSSYSWKVSSYDTTGTYNVIINVSAPTYEKYSTVKTFKVTSISASSSDNSIIRSTSDNTNNDNHPSTETSTSDNTNTHEQHSSSKILMRTNSLGNINSGGSISSAISGGSISNSIGSSADSNSIGGNYNGNGGGSSADQNLNGLAQRIINNVKNNLEMHGIRLP